MSATEMLSQMSKGEYKRLPNPILSGKSSGPLSVAERVTVTPQNSQRIMRIARIGEGIQKMSDTHLPGDAEPEAR